MAIEFACGCGKRYQVGDEFVGRQVTCQACNASLTVPPAGNKVAARPVVRKPAIAAGGAARPAAVSKSGPVPKRAAVRQAPDLDFDSAPRKPRRKKGSAGVLILFGCLAFFFLAFVMVGGGVTFFFWSDIKAANPKWFASANKDKDTDSDTKSETAEKTDPAKPDKKDGEGKTPRDPKDPVAKPDMGDPQGTDTNVKDPPRVKPIDPVKTNDPPPPVAIPAQDGPWKGASGRVLTMAIASDGKTIWTAGAAVPMNGPPNPTDDNSLRQWNLEGKQVGWLKDFKSGIGCAAFSLSLGGELAAVVPAGGPLDPNDTTGALGVWKKGADTNVHLWDLRLRKEKRLLQGNAKEINCVAIAPGGLHVASAGNDQLIHISDAESGTQESALVGHVGPVNVVLFSPDAARVASSGVDKGIRIWNRSSGLQENYLKSKDEIVYAMAFAPRGQLLVSGGGDANGNNDYGIRVWDLAKASVATTLTGHTGRVTALAFSVDGTRVVSGSSDGTVKLWQLPAGKMVGQVNVATEITALAVLADGGRVLIGASDGSLRLWNFPADVAMIIKKLDTAMGAERLNVLRELAPYGMEAAPARAQLLKLAADPDKEVRGAAVELVVQLGPPQKTDVAALTQLLMLRDFPEGRLYALDGLAALGADSKPAIALLTEAVKDTEAVVRAKAALALGAIGADAKAIAFEPLLTLLGDKEKAVVDSAARALTMLGKPEKENARAVARLLTSPSDSARQYALSALRDLGTSAADAGPALITMLGTEKVPALRKQCLLALAQVMPDSKELLTAYSTSLTDADADVSITAAEGLARIGTKGEALAPLLRGLDSPENKVVAICLGALDRGPITKLQVMTLRQALPGRREETRRNVMYLLSKLGPDAADALPGVIEVLKVGDLETRKVAVTLCGLIGPGAKSAGPAIAARLADADAAFRLEIAQTLARIGAPEVKEALPALIKGLKIDNPEAEAELATRKKASDAVVSIGKPAVEALMSALGKEFAGKDKVNVEARIAVMQTLQAIGKPAYSTSVHQRLITILKEDPNPDVKKAVKATIEKLQEK